VRRKLFLLSLVLLPAALLINLGIMVFIDDEAIRSLVAQEMLWSGNYIAPVMHGDAYLNKPPLWNWILALSFTLHGEVNEWAPRLPTVIGLLGFAAWVVYTQIMLLYQYGRRGEWWRAFGWAYGLTAVGFMLKGLPAIVFQGLSVFAILGWTRSWKQFFRPAHLLTGIACVGTLALYYWQYSEYVDLERVARRLFVESGKRTAVAHGFGESVQHVLAFPFEMSYHFLPWTLLLIYLLQPGSWQRLRKNDFAAFTLVAFLVNIPIYWLSPNVYPRYLLMLFPLLFGSLLCLHEQHATEHSLSYRILRYTLLGLMTVCACVIPFAPLFPETSIVSNAWLKSIVLGAAAGAVVWTAWRNDRNLLLLFVVFLLLLRIGFNLFVLPPRAAGDERGILVRNTAYSVMEGRAQDSVAIFGHTLIEPATGYYLTKARGRVVRRQFEGFDRETFYLVSPLEYPSLKVNQSDSLYLRHLSRARADGDVYYPFGTLPNPPRERVEWNKPLRDGMGTGF